MIIKRIKEVVLAALITAAIITLLFSIHELATIDSGYVVSQPNPSCGFVSALPWSPCAEIAPVPGQSGWVPIDDVPGTWGPHGYTPIQGNVLR